MYAQLAIAVVCVFCVLSPASAEIRVKVLPAPKPEDGRVPVYAWTVEWSLRDDKKPSQGTLVEYKTYAEARAVAEKKLADNVKLHGEGNKNKDWTWIKSIEITGTPSLVSLDDLSAKARRGWTPILAGLDKKAEHCNFLVRDIAAEAKVAGLDGKTADEMWGYFKSISDKDGWSRVDPQPAGKDKPAVSAIERANQLASDGYMVVAVITKEQLNANKPEDRDPYTTGHVFVLTPGGGTDWATTLVANAGTGDTPKAKLVSASSITTDWQRPLYQFYAVKIP
jgi:hypothetical protein